MRPQALLRQLQKDKVLPKWAGKTCPHCGVGKLGPCVSPTREKSGRTSAEPSGAGSSFSLMTSILSS